jgi:hypothetical protein
MLDMLSRPGLSAYRLYSDVTRRDDSGVPSEYKGPFGQAVGRVKVRHWIARLEGDAEGSP